MPCNYMKGHKEVNLKTMKICASEIAQQLIWMQQL